MKYVKLRTQHNAFRIYDGEREREKEREGEREREKERI
jgi:hypothetical protein